jgi:hypothetical protein
MELDHTNAHALGWHPSCINEESVKYFRVIMPTMIRKNQYNEEHKIRCVN